MVTDWDKERHYQKGFGVLERWISGYAFKEFADSQGEAHDVRELFALMNQRETSLKRIREGCEHLALALANAVVLLDPDKIILAGSIGYHQYEKIVPIVNETLLKVLPEAFYRKDLIEKALLEPYGVVIGGALMVQSAFLLQAILS
jgi:predicted NBD/HSP70 family sugar kinase